MKTGEILRPRDKVELRSGNTILSGWFVGSDTLRMRFTIVPGRGDPEQREFYKGEKGETRGDVYEVTSERPAPGSIGKDHHNHICAPHERRERRYWRITRIGAPQLWSAEVHA